MDFTLSHETTAPLLKTQRLTKSFGSLVAVNGLNLEVMRGDVLKSIPNYFVGNSLAALIQNQGQFVYRGGTGALSDLQAGLMVAL